MKKVVLLFVVLLFAAKLSAQTIGGGFVVLTPKDDFKAYNKNTGYGFYLEGALMSPSPLTPFTVGLTINYVVLSSEKTSVPLISDIPSVRVDVDRSSNMAGGQLFFRLAPLFGPIKPYVEVLGGGSYLWTETKITSNTQEKPLASATNFDDFTWNYGAGGGVMISLLDGVGGIGSLSLDFKVRYMKGGNAEYLLPENIRETAGKVYYDVVKSDTPHMTYNIGVVLSL